MIFVAICFSAFAHAETISIETSAIQALPSLQIKKLVVDPGPAFAAVQPTASIVFDYMSCSRFAFSAQVEEKGNLLLVSVQLDPLQRECHGPLINREYTLQISSNFHHQVIMLNPLAIPFPGQL